ncbi:hypothetical protein JXB27_00435 [Candidatus Woesearchaeota archaeon]|nr:hypothetical protein [Candidatus Woesearchaeota archaeon]
MNDSILIRNENELNEKIAKIRKDGVSHLHVVSDFDRTLTPAFVRGQKTPTGIAQIREGGYLTPEYPAQAHALFDKYHPIEISETIPQEEKNRMMVEWWNSHLSLIVASGLNKEVIDDIVNKGRIHYRQGTKSFFETLAKHRIPLLIFSAGVGDLIEDSLKFEKFYHSNIHIISNFFDFDANGVAKGYKGAVIHTFNKNEGQVKNSPYYKQIQGRKNTILLGDSLGDTTMLEGLVHETIIKIGFLNENIEEQRVKFEKEYDVVILNDGSFSYINGLIKRII